MPRVVQYLLEESQCRTISEIPMKDYERMYGAVTAYELLRAQAQENQKLD